MLSGAVTNRYTQGLYEAASGGGNVAAVEAGLSALADALRDHTELRTILEHPLIGVDQKLGVVQGVFGDTIPDTVYKFLRVLFARDRSGYIVAIAAAFHERVEAARGRVQLRVESAAPLTDDMRQRIERKVADLTGKQVDLAAVVDERLIAGYRVRFGNRVLDATVKSAIHQFSGQLLAAGASEEGTR